VGEAWGESVREGEAWGRRRQLRAHLRHLQHQLRVVLLAQKQLLLDLEQLVGALVVGVRDAAGVLVRPAFFRLALGLGLRQLRLVVGDALLELLDHGEQLVLLPVEPLHLPPQVLQGVFQPRDLAVLPAVLHLATHGQAAAKGAEG